MADETEEMESSTKTKKSSEESESSSKTKKSSEETESTTKTKSTKGSDEEGGEEKGGEEKGGDMTAKDHFHKQHYKLWVDDAWCKEGDTMKFEVHLNKEADHNIKVYYQTYSGTAKGGKDYHPEKHYVTIEKGEDSAYIYIDTKDDHKKEYKEYFYVKIDEHDPYVKVKDYYGKGWIHDNDGHKHHEHYEHNADVWMG